MLMMYIASMDVNECVFSPDQKFILSAHKDGSVSLWSAINGKSREEKKRATEGKRRESSRDEKGGERWES
jgi:WD40 repeat protein